MSTEIRRLLEDKFFVAGQMDAQGYAAEKCKIGNGGPMLAMSRRLLQEGREALDKLLTAAVDPQWVVIVGSGSFSACYGVFTSYDDTAHWLKSNGWTTSDCDIRPIRSAGHPPTEAQKDEEDTKP